MKALGVVLVVWASAGSSFAQEVDDRNTLNTTDTSTLFKTEVLEIGHYGIRYSPGGTTPIDWRERVNNDLAKALELEFAQTPMINTLQDASGFVDNTFEFGVYILYDMDIADPPKNTDVVYVIQGQSVESYLKSTLDERPYIDSP